MEEDKSVTEYERSIQIDPIRESTDLMESSAEVTDTFYPKHTHPGKLGLTNSGSAERFKSSDSGSAASSAESKSNFRDRSPLL